MRGIALRGRRRPPPARRSCRARPQRARYDSALAFDACGPQRRVRSGSGASPPWPVARPSRSRGRPPRTRCGMQGPSLPGVRVALVSRNGPGDGRWRRRVRFGGVDVRCYCWEARVRRRWSAVKRPNNSMHRSRRNMCSRSGRCRRAGPVMLDVRPQRAPDVLATRSKGHAGVRFAPHTRHRRPRCGADPRWLTGRAVPVRSVRASAPPSPRTRAARTGVLGAARVRASRRLPSSSHGVGAGCGDAGRDTAACPAGCACGSRLPERAGRWAVAATVRFGARYARCYCWEAGVRRRWSAVKRPNNSMHRSRRNNVQLLRFVPSRRPGDAGRSAASP
jgi:hypothetical protein